MTAQSTKQLVELIQKSRLISTEELKSHIEAIKVANDGRIPKEGIKLAKFLISEGALTRWQYEKLKNGRFKGFFLGKYRLLGHLGSGGMSSVYLADHELMNRQVAIKVLPPNRINDKSFLERFYIEARSVAVLDHPNIVRAYDVGNEGDTHYLVMEYVRGKDLHSYVKSSDRPIKFGLAANFIALAARGLQHAHDAGLIHRDIKPANLLVEENGNVKILDLGLALATETDGSVTKDHDQKVLGTADYLAPEQALDCHSVDARADIYSLGCTLYFAIAGRPPFNEGTLAQRIAQHQAADPPGLRTLRPDCPEVLAEICHRMINKSPDERFQSAAEVESALNRWVKDAKVALPIPDEIPVIITTQKNGATPDTTKRNNDSTSIQLNVDQSHKSISRKRISRARKPPIGLWVSLLLLSIIAIGLLAYVVTMN